MLDATSFSLSSSTNPHSLSHTGDQRQQFMMATEYHSRGTLKSYLMRHSKKKLPLKIVLQLALDLAKGLSHLHSMKIIHKDVKTETFFLDKDCKLKIADVGVARFESLEQIEKTGRTGTLAYMAPEVLDGKPYDYKCDVYSFGICLWEMYCCQTPFPPSNFGDLSSAIVKKGLRPTIPKHCPKSLAKIMKSCWASEPRKRPEMKDVVSSLEAIDPFKEGGLIPSDHQAPAAAQCFPLFHRSLQTKRNNLLLLVH